MKKIYELRDADVTMDGEEPAFEGRIYGHPHLADGQKVVISPLLEEVEEGVFRTPRGLYRVTFRLKD